MLISFFVLFCLAGWIYYLNLKIQWLIQENQRAHRFEVELQKLNYYLRTHHHSNQNEVIVLKKFEDD